MKINFDVSKLTATTEELDEFFKHPFKQTKIYNYTSGLEITVLINNPKKPKHLFLYDASLSESKYDKKMSMFAFWTKRRKIFWIANIRNKRYKEENDLI